jgi:hypothetical protein
MVMQSLGVRCQGGCLPNPEISYETSSEDFVGLAKNSEFVMPVPDQPAMPDPASRISWNCWIPATGSIPAQTPPE